MRAKSFQAGFTWVLVLTMMGMMGAGALAAEKPVVYVVKDKDAIYYGSGTSPKTPAIIRADEVWEEIPEYKKIIEDDLGDDDPAYHLLMKKATERFNGALKKIAKREGYDMIGEEGAIKVKGKPDEKLTDATDDAIEIVSRS